MLCSQSSLLKYNAIFMSSSSHLELLSMSNKMISTSDIIDRIKSPMSYSWLCWITDTNVPAYIVNQTSQILLTKYAFNIITSARIFLQSKCQTNLWIVVDYSKVDQMWEYCQFIVEFPKKYDVLYEMYLIKIMHMMFYINKIILSGLTIIYFTFYQNVTKSKY